MEASPNVPEHFEQLPSVTGGCWAQGGTAGTLLWKAKSLCCPQAAWAPLLAVDLAENTLLSLCAATGNTPGSRAIDPEQFLMRG